MSIFRSVSWSLNNMEFRTHTYGSRSVDSFVVVNLFHKPTREHNPMKYIINTFALVFFCFQKIRYYEIIILLKKFIFLRKNSILLNVIIILYELLLIFNIKEIQQIKVELQILFFKKFQMVFNSICNVHFLSIN